jgi:hypothetical protein
MSTVRLHATLSNAELGILKNLASTCWLGFYAQEKSIIVVPQCATEFSAPGLVVETDHFVEVGVAAIDLPDHDEAFRVQLSVDHNFGVESWECRFRPRRTPLTVFPEKLSLGNFLRAPLEVKILQFQTRVSNELEVIADECILVSRDDRTKLLISPDTHIVQNLRLTMNLAVIDQYIQRSTTIIPIV